MTLIFESCSLIECCAALDGTPKLLFELRDRLREWLELQPHLPKDVPNEKLEQVILGTKMSLEQSKQKLDMYYTLKSHVPELFANRDPRTPSLINIHNLAQIVYLPKLTPERYSVAIFRPIADDYKNFNAYDCYKLFFMMTEIQMHETRSLGTVVILDQTKSTLSFIAAHTPTLIKKCEVATIEGFAVRIKSIHFLNAPGLTNQLIILVKTVLKPKLAARINTHLPGNYEKFHQFVPPSILPKDYGGDEISMAQLSELWLKKVDDCRDWFLEQDKNLVDERLRPGPTLDSDNLFGISGSFRKLDIE